MRRTLAGAAVAAIAFFAVPCFAQEKLVVWWEKGFYRSEDDALGAAIKRFEIKTGVKVDLSQYAGAEMVAKSAAALESGTPPDLAYANAYDMQLAGKWAFDGKLEDISDLIEPIKDRFAPVAVETVHLYNDQTKKRAYYAFPTKLVMLHIQYWKDMLATAGFKESDIPGTWKEYWSFWCDKVQPDYRTATGHSVYGVGNPMGVDEADSFLSFYSWLDAYNVRLVDDSGKILVDDPKVRAGMIAALKDYTEPYLKGCTPPSSTTWKDRDNGVAFNARTTIMTHNYGISIVTKWLDDANNEQLTPEQRATGRKAYDDLIATAGLPKKPDGSPLANRTSVKVGVIFRPSKNKTRAREFIRFLLEPENLGPYVESALGRWFPATKAGQKSGFWQADKHRKAIYDQFASGALPFEFTKNHKFTILDKENVWAKAMNRVVSEKVPVDKAVDEIIARIKEVAG
ncbi:MAG: ABC transporter substrate-binding protein [Reyranellales bacterium]